MISTSKDDIANTVVSNFYQLLLAGDFVTILDAFAAEPRIDAPRTGAVVGYDAVQKFLEEERSWLVSRGASSGSVKDVKITKTGKRIVQEVGIVLPPVPPKPRPHMFAVVADLTAEGIRAMRLYYCYGVISGNENFLRTSMLSAGKDLKTTLPPVVRAYTELIAAADFSVLELFAENGSVTGAPSIAFTGCTMVRFFAAALAEKGGVPLQLATVTNDGKTCALEENLESWGTIQFERSAAGLAVYDYSGDKITAVRIYDDIPDNPFSRPGLLLKNWETITKRIREAGCGELNFKPSPELNSHQIKTKFLFG